MIFRRPKPLSPLAAEQMARENSRPLSSAKCFALGALGLSPAAERDAEESQRRAEAMNRAWRLIARD